MVRMQKFEISRRSLLALSPRRNSEHPDWTKPEGVRAQAARRAHSEPRQLQMGEKPRSPQHS
jgi:hypothetical protein